MAEDEEEGKNKKEVRESKDQILNHKAETWRAEERGLRSFIFMYVCCCGDRRENQGNAVMLCCAVLCSGESQGSRGLLRAVNAQ